MEESIVNLSRLQFAVTAMYHFLFVPLTIGLSLIIAIMESVYVMTNKQIWRNITQFWGKVFAINFAMGVATGITMEFQFGTNWAYYAHFVGDIFGVPLAIEGMMAFFLESTFVGLMFFGWNKLSKIGHLFVTWLTAIGANLSALWILIANGWMQNPVGSKFNFHTMRMELDSIYEVIFNNVAQAKFVHTVSAGYVTGSIFVLSISAFYLLKNRHVEIAKRSMAVAASFGLASALSVVVLGDESGYTANQNQKAKIAAIEAMWETEKAPAGFTLFGIPDEENHKTLYEIKIPYALGIIVTRSFNTPVLGIKDLISDAKMRIKDGLIAYNALDYLRNVDRSDLSVQEAFKDHEKNLGYALLLKKFVDNPMSASEDQIDIASKTIIPKITPLFWSFRLMVALGLFFILLFSFAFYYSTKHDFSNKIFLRVAVFSFPFPWVASELGWFVAEYGRQPWVVEGYLPTFLGVSSVPYMHILSSLSGFIIFYSSLLIVDVYLMLKYISIGPNNLVERNSL